MGTARNSSEQESRHKANTQAQEQQQQQQRQQQQQVSGGHAAAAAALAPLDGLRVFMNALIVLAHVTYVLGTPPMQHQHHAMLQANVVVRWFQGLLAAAMEVFFLLTGLLAVYYLVPAMETGPPLKVTLSYLKRRALRILPQYYLTVLLYWAAAHLLQASGHPQSIKYLGFCPDKEMPPDISFQALLHYLTFTHNRMDLGGFIVQAWNLAVQAQFYAMLPLLLMLLQPQSRGFRGRVAGLAAAMVCVSLAWRTHQVKETGIRLPLANHQWPGDAGYAPFITFLRFFYMSLPGRFSNLAAGMLLGLLALSPSAQAAVRRHCALTTAAAVAAKLLILIIALPLAPEHYAPDVSRGQVTEYVAIVVILGLFFPVSVGVLVASLMCDVTQAGRPARTLLSARFWKVPAKLSYSAYLLHILCMRAVVEAMQAAGFPSHRLVYGAPGLLMQTLAVAGVWAASFGLSLMAAVGLDAVASRLVSKLRFP